jgi:lipopolysaccharide/colanic/teichoic acid biosynthesis glycosyltransferase
MMPHCREAQHPRNADLHTLAPQGPLKVRVLNWARAKGIAPNRRKLRRPHTGGRRLRDASHNSDRAREVFNGLNDLTGFAVAENYSLALTRLQAREPIVEPAGCQSTAYRVLKRLLDIVGAIVAFVLFLPILVPVFVVLLITMRGRPFYTQERVGYCGRRFKMIKFRTMRLDADKLRHLVPNEKDGPIFKAKRDPRITRVGRLLRKTSIDELPQLFNVLMGDMSLVGPRPALAKEVAQYAPWQRRRFCVMPGLTCLWQVSGRSDIDFDQWVRMDLWYVRHQSLWTDIKLLLRTPWTVISMRGAY